MNALRQQELYHAAHKILDIGELAPLVVPGVNINGTSANELVQQLIDVVKAIDILDEAFARANPHGRDFQISGGDKLAEIARAAWRQRRLLLAMMREEIHLLATSISEQGRT